MIRYWLFKILISISVFDFVYYWVSYLVQISVQTALANVDKHTTCFRKSNSFSPRAIFARWQPQLCTRVAHACRAWKEKALQLMYGLKLKLWLSVILERVYQKNLTVPSAKSLLCYINTQNPQSFTLLWLSALSRNFIFKNWLQRLIYLYNFKMINLQYIATYFSSADATQQFL